MKKFLLLFTFVFSTLSYAGEIHEAVSAGDLERVSELLDNGADINALDENGNSLFDLTESVDMAGLILKKSGALNHLGDLDLNELEYLETETLLLMAIWTDESKLVEKLIENNFVGINAPLHIKGRFKNTATHVAACLGALDTLNYLIGKGADVDAVNADGATALTFSVVCDRPKATKILTENGANINALDQENKDWLLRVATKYNKPEISKQLVDNGANINALDEDGAPVYFEQIPDDVDVANLVTVLVIGLPIMMNTASNMLAGFFDAFN